MINQGTPVKDFLLGGASAVWPAIGPKTRIGFVPDVWHYRLPLPTPLSTKLTWPPTHPEHEDVELQRTLIDLEGVPWATARMGYGPKSDTLLVMQNSFRLLEPEEREAILKAQMSEEAFFRFLHGGTS